MDIFFRHKKTTILGVHFYAFKGQDSMYKMGILLGVTKISNIVLGLPDIPDIFGGKQYMKGQRLRSKKN